MKPNSIPKYDLRTISLRLVAAAIISMSPARAQEAPPGAASPIPAPSADNIPLPPAPRKAVEKPMRRTPPLPPEPIKPSPAIVEPALGAPASLEPIPVETPSPNYGASYKKNKSPAREKATGGSFTKAQSSARLVSGILEEELTTSPEAAAKKYEALISNFDQQREAAAQAIFRLGESYRKMGRIEEARVMYGRILREFVDYSDLAKLSQRLLTENPPIKTQSTFAFAAAPANPAEEELIQQELAILDEQLTAAEALVKTGQAPSSSVLPHKREIVQLKQRLARTRAEGWPTPATTEVEKPQATISTSRPSRASTSRLRAEMRELESEIRLLSDTTHFENISTQVVTDPRFAELKGAYEKRLLNGSDSNESRNLLDDARGQLNKWIQEIYLPELHSTLSVKKMRLENALKDEAQADEEASERRSR